MVTVRAFARRTRRAVALYGFASALMKGAHALRGLTTRARRDPFDERFGVNTAGIVRLEGLTVRGEQSLGVRYQASDTTVVRRLLNDLPIRTEEFTFVDFGSGKGRVVLVAAQLPFKTVIGVEFSEELHEIALANLAQFPTSARSCDDVRLLCQDAATFDPPPDPLVLYFYNPFLEPVMRTVMTNVTASLERDPRPVYVLLAGDQSLAAAVVSAGFATLGGGVFTR